MYLNKINLSLSLFLSFAIAFSAFAETTDIKFRINGPQKVVCAGGAFTMTASGSSSYEFAWYPEQYFKNSHTKTVNTSITRTTQFMVVRSGHHSALTDTAYLTVVVEKEEVELLGEKQFCVGERTFLELPGNFANTTWSTGQVSKGIWVTTPGVYRAEAVVDCKTIVGEVNVKQLEKPLARIVTFDDLDICKGEEVAMSVFGDVSQFNWSTGESTEVIRINQTQEVELTVENECGVSTDKLQVTVHEVDASFIPSKSQGEVPFKLYLQNESHAKASNVWLVNGEEFSKDIHGEIEITELGDYEIELVRTNEFGCEEKMKYGSIVALPAPPKTVDEDKLVVFPNSFTPNGDGLNDEFVFESNFISEINFNIFDRWGREIFSSDNSEGWDGTLPNGANASVGTYIIMYEFTDLDGAIISRTVQLHLLR